MENPRKNPDLIFYRPWMLFSIFLLANGLLAYGSMGFQSGLWVVVMGLALPFFLALFHLPPADDEKTLGKTGGSPEIPAWIWILTAVAGLGIRLYLNFLRAPWPSLDDSVNAYYAAELDRNWTWHFFFGSSQVPALFHWLLALFFKVLGPSLFSMRLFPFLFSALTFTVVWLGGRASGSNLLALFGAMAMGSGFWPLYTGEFCMSPVFFLFLEVVSLLLLAWLQRAALLPRAPQIAFGLGVATGIGFFAAIPWPLVALMIGWAVFRLSRTEKSAKVFVPFLIPASALFLLFIAAAIHENYGERFLHLWVFRSNTQWNGQFFQSLSNLTALFWKSYSPAYGPTWGGMFNPLLGSTFLLGLLECARRRRQWFPQWLLV
ncbi:MAG TPA: hypothetical protein VK859_01765, partial [bacterium]|nr:hypothetical protein [bacterium]